VSINANYSMISVVVNKTGVHILARCAEEVLHFIGDKLPGRRWEKGVRFFRLPERIDSTIDVIIEK
jgi:hypothetical protein